MKKVVGALFILLIVAAGCKKVNELFTFDISDSQNIKIPASGILNVPVISPVPVTMNSEETFQNNHTNANLVKDVKLNKLTLTITDPATENFNFLKSINIWIGTDQNDKVPLASLDNVPADVSVIELISDQQKLDKYIKASSYTLYTEVSLKSNVAKDLNIRADSRFRVTADPL